jgi:hypothetical protein
MFVHCPFMKLDTNCMLTSHPGTYCLIVSLALVDKILLLQGVWQGACRLDCSQVLRVVYPAVVSSGPLCLV